MMVVFFFIAHENWRIFLLGVYVYENSNSKFGEGIAILNSYIVAYLLVLQKIFSYLRTQESLCSLYLMYSII